MIFDFGEWKSEVASRRNSDGSITFRIVDATSYLFNFELIAVDGAKRTINVRDEPYEYTFTEKEQ